MNEKELDNRNSFTTEPEAKVAQPKGAGDFTMPEPVLRQTSGYLPQGFGKQYHQPAAKPAEPDAPVVPAAPAADADSVPPDVPYIEPQPYVSEEFSNSALNTTGQPKPAGRTGLHIILITVGIAAVVALAIGFIAAVYFLFIASRAAESAF